MTARSLVFLVAIAIGCCTAINSGHAQGPHAQGPVAPPAGRSAPATMSASEAHARSVAGEIVLIDIRTPQEWTETGLPLTAHANNMHDDPRVFLQRLLTIVGGDRSRPVALICRTGNRSSTLQGHLAKAGFTNVVDVAEGMAGSRHGKGWLKLGLPTRPGSLASVPPAVASGASKP